MNNIPYVYYNLTNLTSAGNDTTILTFVSEVNTMMNGVPALLMLIAINIILVMALIGKGFDPFKVFASTSFAMVILAVILYPMSLISGFTLILFCVLSPISIFVLWVFGDKAV